MKEKLDPPGVTLKTANWLCFALGMAIVWLASHSLLACLGAWVASIHIRLRFKELEG